MKIAVISGTPKSQGLCHSIIEAVKRGAADGGAEVVEVKLCELDLRACQVCDDGWGICRAEHRCIMEDDFADVKALLASCDAFVLATPVYWWEVSEPLKNFMDRVRRCEFGQEGALSGKQALLIAVPGGSGNGMLSCLEQMERFCRHTGASIFDYIGVNRWNSDYKREAAYAAARSIALGRRNGQTV